MGGRKNGAIAVFVKTPGLSPIKTRLADSVGRTEAEKFHVFSAKCIEVTVLAATAKIFPAPKPYWAVAEEAGVIHPLWGSFQAIPQGNGGLGERLARVYSGLLQNHGFVILLGADSPQMETGLLVEAAHWAVKGDFVLGPTEDGGFYVFSGSSPIEEVIWKRIPFSSSQTMGVLKKNLEPLGSIHFLPTLFDVDREDDLMKLKTALTLKKEPSIEQVHLKRWVEKLL